MDDTDLACGGIEDEREGPGVELLPPGSYLDIADLSAPLDPAALFGRRAPFEMEIGAGRGDFALAYARAFPDRDLLAVERNLVVLRKGAKKLARVNRPNLKLLVAEAMNVLENYTAPGTLAALHVYFPDPWPKRRHEGRRVVRDTTLETMLRALVPGGLLHLRTDHAGYFARMMEATEARRDLTQIEIDPALLAAKTAFEERFESMGHPIHRISYRYTPLH